MAKTAWNHAPITAANTAKDGTGVVAVVFDAPSEMYVDRIVFRSLGTNVATVARIFLNTGEDNDTPSQNSLIAEITLPATTLDETAALVEQKVVADFRIEEGNRILVTLGTAVSAGYQVTTFATLTKPIQ